MLLNDLLNGANVVRWKKRGDEITRHIVTGPDLRPHRQLVQVEKESEGDTNA